MTNASDRLKEARAEYEALASDTPKLQDLLTKREEEFAAARKAGKSLEQLADLRSKRDGVASMLDRHKEDVEEAKQAVAELDTATRDEDALDVIAAQTLKFRQAEAAWYKIMDEAETAVRRAVTLSDYLARAASTARNHASKAAGQIVARNGGNVRDQDATAEQLRRGVAGAKVDALTPATTMPQTWVTHPHGGRFEALAKLPGNRAGMWATIEDPAAETGVEQ